MNLFELFQCIHKLCQLPRSRLLPELDVFLFIKKDLTWNFKILIQELEKWLTVFEEGVAGGSVEPNALEAIVTVLGEVFRSGQDIKVSVGLVGRVDDRDEIERIVARLVQAVLDNFCHHPQTRLVCDLWEREGKNKYFFLVDCWRIICTWKINGCYCYSITKFIYVRLI